VGGWNLGSIGGSDAFQQFFFSFLVARIYFLSFFFDQVKI
jgi:hypothetical protein